MNKVVSKTRIGLVLSVAVAISTIISATAFADSPLTADQEAEFSQNDDLYWQPCETDSPNEEICGENQNYAGETVFNEAEIAAIEKFQPIYEEAASKYGFPWQILAVLHYREHSLEKSNPGNGQGVYQLYSYTDGGTNSNSFWPEGAISDEEFQRQSNITADILAGKAKDGNIDLANMSDDDVKHLLFRFNGMGNGVVFEKKAEALGFDDPAEGSAYVMNRYDAQRDPNSSEVNSAWIGNYTTDGNWSASEKDQRWGTYTAYKALTCDSDGGDGAVDDGGPDDTEGLGGEPDDDNSTGSTKSANSVSNAKKITETALKLVGNSDSPSDAFVEATKQLGTWEGKGQNKAHGPDCGYFVKAVIATANPDIVYKPGDAHMDPFRNKLKNGNKKYTKYWDVIDFSDGDTSKLQSGDIVWGYTDKKHQHYWLAIEKNGKLHKFEASYGSKKWGHDSGKIPKSWKSYKTRYIFRPKGDADTVPCNSCEQGSLNINGTGACLAWPLGSKESDYAKRQGGQATELQREAIVKYGGAQWQYYLERPFCSGFTAAVVRWTGYDKKFPFDMNSNEPTQAIKANRELWDVIDWNGDESVLKGGDIINCVKHDHSWMVVEDENGELYTAEASKSGATFGHIVKYYNQCGSSAKIIRAKNANNSSVGVSVTNGVKTSSATGSVNGNGCSLCPTESDPDDGNGKLKDGGFKTTAEADKAVMSRYRQYKAKISGGNTELGTNACTLGQKANYGNGTCENPSQDNCSTFSAWFIKNYLGWDPTLIPDKGGAGFAQSFYNTFHSKYPKIKISNTPTPYSIASWNSSMHSPSGSNYHTAVILGVDVANDNVIVGEAGWADHSFLGVHDKDYGSGYKLSSMKGKGIYVDVSAYVKK